MWLLFTIVFSWVVLDGSGSAGCKRMVCYYANWSQNEPEPWKYTPDNIDVDLCTHLVFAYVHIENLQPKISQNNDIEMYKKLNELKKKKPGLKTLLAVGGWNQTDTEFQNVVATEASRETMNKNTIKFLREHDFDGFDLHWEFPTPEDKANFTLWCKDLRIAFQQEAARTSQLPLLLTAAVAAGRDQVDQVYQVKAVVDQMDFLSLMTYDFFGSWDTETGHNSPLYAHPLDKGNKRYYNIDSAVQYFLELGAPREKLNVGLALYGRAFYLKHSKLNGVKATTTGGGPMGNFTKAVGFYSYYEVCLKLMDGGTVKRIPEQEVPFAVIDKIWIGFDDEESIRNKVRYTLDNQLGGILFWEINYDDFPGEACGKGEYPLMKAAFDECGYNTTNTTSGAASLMDNSRNLPVISLSTAALNIIHVSLP